MKEQDFNCYGLNVSLVVPQLHQYKTSTKF